MELLVGAIVSVIVELVTRYFGTTTVGSVAAFLVISAIGGGVYVWIQSTPYLDTLLQVASYASLIYAVLIHPINKASEGRL